MILQQWLSTWFDLYLVPRGLAPHTLAAYRRSIAAVPAALASLPLDQVTALDLRRWQVARQAAAPRAAQLDRCMLLQAMRVAAKLGLWAGCLDTDTLPRIPHRAARADVLTAEQLRAYVSALPSAAPDVAPLLMLCCCGLRRSEALGALWADLRPEDHSLLISGQRYRLPGSYARHPLKTAAAMRRLILPPATWAACYHRRRLSVYIVDATPELLARRHRAALQAAGCPVSVTLHGLRHTAATLAADQISMHQLQMLLGHSRIALTSDLYALHQIAPINPPQSEIACGL